MINCWFFGCICENRSVFFYSIKTVLVITSKTGFSLRHIVRKTKRQRQTDRKAFRGAVFSWRIPGWCGRRGFGVEEARGKSKQYLADTVHYFFISTCTPLSLGPWGCAHWITSVAPALSLHSHILHTVRMEGMVNSYKPQTHKMLSKNADKY